MNINSRARVSFDFIITIFFVIFLIVCILYFYSFSYNLTNYQDSQGFFQRGLNIHDHIIYEQSMGKILFGKVSLTGNNDYGIALLYLLLIKLLPWLINLHFTLIAFIFNTSILILSFVIYNKICNKFNIGVLGKLLFFTNTYFIYFTQLINKDMLTVFFFLLMVYFGSLRKFYILIILLPIVLLVRQQLAFCIILYIYLMKSPGMPTKKIIFIYLITSFLAGYLSLHGGYITDNVMRDGFSSILVVLNHYMFYTTYIIFNPLRAIQYVFSGYSAFFPIDDYGGFDLFRLLCIPEMIVFTYFLPYIIKIFKKFKQWTDDQTKAMFMTIITYLLAWLMNPTVNERYVMLIMPVIILFALHIKINHYKKVL